MKNTAKVIIPDFLDQNPEEHEISAAKLLADHYNAEVIFLKRNLAYKAYSADIMLHSTEWEIKSPKSSNSYKIEKRMSKAAKQSQTGRIIVDYRRTKLTDKEMDKIVIDKFKSSRTIKRLIVIKKSGKIIDFSK